MVAAGNNIRWRQQSGGMAWQRQTGGGGGSHRRVRGEMATASNALSHRLSRAKSAQADGAIRYDGRRNIQKVVNANMP